MSPRALRLAAAVLAAAAVATAQLPPSLAGGMQVECIENPLGPVPDWTLVIHEDLSQSNSDSEGRIAVGGDASLTNFGVASRLPVNEDRVDLAVGGDLNATNVGVNNGSITFGGSLTGNATAPNGTVEQEPLNLDALFQEAQRRADAWHELDANGTVSGPDSGALSMTGNDTTLNVFRVRASRLESAQRILLRVPFGSSTLVNVLGTSFDTSAPQLTVSLEFWDGNGYVQFGDDAPSTELESLRRSLLWNFADATSIQIGPQLAWHGTVLAPGAAMAFPGNTQLNGTIVVESLTGDGESHLHPPDEICLPDPGTDPPNPDIDPPGPDTEAEIPSFVAPGDGSGSLPQASRRTNFDVVKQTLNRRGRPVELLRTTPGRVVRFRLRAYNLGFTSARGVVVCDRFPRGLRLTSAPGDPSIRGREICWRLGTVATQRQAVVRFRVGDGVCGRLVNRLGVRSNNGGRDRDAAQASACRRVAPLHTG